MKCILPTSDRLPASCVNEAGHAVAFWCLRFHGFLRLWRNCREPEPGLALTLRPCSATLTRGFVQNDSGGPNPCQPFRMSQAVLGEWLHLDARCDAVGQSKL